MSRKNIKWCTQTESYFFQFFFLLLKRKHHLRLKWSWSDKCQTTQPSIQDYPGYPKPPSVYSSFGFVLVLGGLCTLYKRNLLRLTIWDVPKSWIRGINEVDVGKLISIISFYLYSLFRCWDKKKMLKFIHLEGKCSPPPPQFDGTSVEICKS